MRRGEASGDPALLAAMVIGIFLETAVFAIYGRLPGPLLRYAKPVAAAAGTALSGLMRAWQHLPEAIGAGGCPR